MPRRSSLSSPRKKRPRGSIPRKQIRRKKAAPSPSKTDWTLPFAILISLLSAGVITWILLFKNPQDGPLLLVSRQEKIEPFIQQNPQAEVFKLGKPSSPIQTPSQPTSSSLTRPSPSPPPSLESAPPQQHHPTLTSSPLSKTERTISPEGEHLESLHPPTQPSPTPPSPEKTQIAQAIAIPTATLAPTPFSRAIPLNPQELTTERLAAYQVALERLHFSCGFVDGTLGKRTQRALSAFQQSRGLPITGQLDVTTQAVIGEPGEPFTTYTVTLHDMAKIQPTPLSWKDKSKAEWLGYNNAWEMMAEKFHCTVQYLKTLNPDIVDIQSGSILIGPKVFPPQPFQKAASLRIFLEETTLQALNLQGQIIAHFPCSIARDKKKRPQGRLTVRNIAPHPNYTFNPHTFPEIATKEQITQKLIIPPGPNNPVGTAWIGLSLPGYGIHGTPEPENISRTQSSGCFRLSNWNAQKLLKMIEIGMPVDVLPSTYNQVVN